MKKTEGIQYARSLVAILQEKCLIDGVDCEYIDILDNLLGSYDESQEDMEKRCRDFIDDHEKSFNEYFLNNNLT